MSTAAEHARLTRLGFWLEYASMAWMTVEAMVAITAGVLASSIALVAFGLDSVIEFAAAAIVVWQLRGGSAKRERRAVRLIGVTFFALAAYLLADSIHDLIAQVRPVASIPGIIVTAAALLVMPLLALAKLRTGRALGNRTLIADAAESALCAFTSGAALLGVGLNAGLGWWWADPAAALVIAALAVRKGFEAWEEEDEDDDSRLREARSTRNLRTSMAHPARAALSLQGDAMASRYPPLAAGLPRCCSSASGPGRQATRTAGGGLQLQVREQA